MVVSGSGLAHDLYPPTHGPIPLAELLPFAFDAHVLEEGTKPKAKKPAARKAKP